MLQKKKISIKSSFTSLKQKGQSIVLAMFLMLVAAASMVVLYNTAQIATEKTRLVNAADAAAYSGAVWTARQLNFMAYTNRAMIANHVVAGHMVSYVSWIRYVENVSSNIQNITNIIATVTSVIPGLNAVTSAINQAATVIEQVADIEKQVAEGIATVTVPLISVLNTAMSTSQWAAYANMQGTISGFSPLSQVMTKAADYHLSANQQQNLNIRINHPNDAQLSVNHAPIFAAIGAEQLKLLNFTKNYTASNNNNNRMKIAVRNNYGPSEPWLNDRRWRLWLPLPPLGNTLRKNANSTQTLGNYSNWEASDSFTNRYFTGIKWRTATYGRGNATAREFASNYSGVPRYFDLKDLTPKNDSLNITALAAMPIAQARLKNLLGLNTSVTQMSAVGRAEVHHYRPISQNNIARLVASSDKYNEYTNVYNPFWQARMIDPPSFF